MADRDAELSAAFNDTSRDLTAAEVDALRFARDGVQLSSIVERLRQNPSRNCETALVQLEVIQRNERPSRAYVREVRELRSLLLDIMIVPNVGTRVFSSVVHACSHPNARVVLDDEFVLDLYERLRGVVHQHGSMYEMCVNLGWYAESACECLRQVSVRHAAAPTELDMYIYLSVIGSATLPLTVDRLNELARVIAGLQVYHEEQTTFHVTRLLSACAQDGEILKSVMLRVDRFFPMAMTLVGFRRLLASRSRNVQLMSRCIRSSNAGDPDAAAAGSGRPRGFLEQSMAFQPGVKLSRSLCGAILLKMAPDVRTEVIRSHLLQYNDMVMTVHVLDWVGLVRHGCAALAETALRRDIWTIDDINSAVNELLRLRNASLATRLCTTHGVSDQRVYADLQACADAESRRMVQIPLYALREHPGLLMLARAHNVIDDEF